MDWVFFNILDFGRCGGYRAILVISSIYFFITLTPRNRQPARPELQGVNVARVFRLAGRRAVC